MGEPGAVAGAEAWATSPLAPRPPDLLLYPAPGGREVALEDPPGLVQTAACRRSGFLLFVFENRGDVAGKKKTCCVFVSVLIENPGDLGVFVSCFLWKINIKMGEISPQKKGDPNLGPTKQSEHHWLVKNNLLNTRSSSREVRIRVPLFLSPFLAGEPSHPKKGARERAPGWGTSNRYP